jgi:hypothetical protein
MGTQYHHLTIVRNDCRRATTGGHFRRPAWVLLTRFRGVGVNATGLVGLLTLVGMSLDRDIVLLQRARRNGARGMEREAEAGAS